MKVQEIVINYLESFEQRKLRIKTWFHGLDKLLNGGVDYGQVVLIAGSSRMGKTGICLSLMGNFIQQGIKTAFVTDEPKSQVATRLLSQVTKIESNHLFGRQLQDREWPKLSENSVKLVHEKNDEIFNFHHDDWVNTDARVIFIDAYSFSKLKPFELLRSKFPDKIIFITAPTHDRIERRPNKRPMLSDLHDDFVALTDISDVAIFLYRHDVYYRDDHDDRGVAELIVAKNRTGTTDTIRMAHLEEYGGFWVNLSE